MRWSRKQNDRAPTASERKDDPESFDDCISETERAIAHASRHLGGAAKPGMSAARVSFIPCCDRVQRSEIKLLENAKGGSDVRFRFQKTITIQIAVENLNPHPTPAQSFSEWNMPGIDIVIAIIPCDEASLQTAVKAFKDHKHPRDSTLYVGHYLIRAKLMNWSNSGV